MFKHYKNEVENQLNKKIKDSKNIKHQLMNFVFKMVLLIKLLFFIHHNKITLQNVKIKHYKKLLMSCW
jgi:hypothetical protein